MSDPEGPEPVIVPPPVQGEGPPAPPSRPVRVVYLRYRDPSSLEFPERPGPLTGPIFHAAGVLLREDEQFLALGEIAYAQENEPLAHRYGGDLFPAYRNILTIPQASIVERHDLTFPSVSTSSREGPDPRKRDLGQS